MRIERAKFGVDYEAKFDAAKLEEGIYEENQDFIPGQVGPAKVILRSFTGSNAVPYAITIDRENTSVPSAVINYRYVRKNGIDRLLMSEAYFHVGDKFFLVERTKALDNPNLSALDPKAERIPFPNNQNLQTLASAFVQPKPGESPNLRGALNEAKKAKHPAFKFLRDGKNEALLFTRFETDTTPGGGIAYLVASVIRFTKGDKIQIASITSKSLIGASDESLEPLPIRREFLYTDGKLTGRKQYVGDELIYADVYTPRILDGVEVWDIERQYGKWAQEQSQARSLRDVGRVTSVDSKTGSQNISFQRVYLPEPIGGFVTLGDGISVPLGNPPTISFLEKKELLSLYQAAAAQSDCTIETTGKEGELFELANGESIPIEKGYLAISITRPPDAINLNKFWGEFRKLEK